MGYDNEKRRGADRRNQDCGPPRGHNDRRSSDDRRQTDIAEISYFEWASYFVKFQGKAISDSASSLAESAATVLSRAR